MSVFRRLYQLTSAGKIDLSHVALQTRELEARAAEISKLKYFLGMQSWPKTEINRNREMLLNVTSKEDFWSIARSDINQASPYSVLDIGCGVRPFNLDRFGAHVCLEPFLPYAKVLAHRYAGKSGIIPLIAKAPADLHMFPDNSFDSVFLLDVVEHMSKVDGLNAIEEAKRIARESVHVFTPLGFMEQHVGPDDDDGWGYSGNELQTHISGWEPSEFPDFYVTVMENYHEVPSGTFGAIWASFYKTSRKQNLTLLIPKALDESEDWNQVLDQFQVTFNFDSVRVCAEMAPWSFRTKPVINFPKTNLDLVSNETVVDVLEGFGGGGRVIVAGDLETLHAVSGADILGKCLFVLDDSLNAVSLEYESPKLHVVALGDFNVEAASFWLLENS